MQTNIRVKRNGIGLGLFATELILKGKRIIEYTGEVITNDEADKRKGMYLFRINSRWTVDGSPRSNTGRYINHSCRPNAEAVIYSKRVFINSKRKILPGEEITIHYGKEFFDDFIKPKECQCAKCLK